MCAVRNGNTQHEVRSLTKIVNNIFAAMVNYLSDGAPLSWWPRSTEICTVATASDAHTECCQMLTFSLWSGATGRYWTDAAG